jgi:hypothetical protein
LRLLPRAGVNSVWQGKFQQIYSKMDQAANDTTTRKNNYSKAHRHRTRPWRVLHIRYFLAEIDIEPCLLMCVPSPRNVSSSGWMPLPQRSAAHCAVKCSTLSHRFLAPFAPRPDIYIWAGNPALHPRYFRWEQKWTWERKLQFYAKGNESRFIVISLSHKVRQVFRPFTLAIMDAVTFCVSVFGAIRQSAYQNPLTRQYWILFLKPNKYSRSHMYCELVNSLFL